MRKKTILSALFVTILVASGMVLSSESMPAPAEDYRFTIQTVTCGDLYELLQDAAMEEGMEPEIKEKAQNVLLYFVIWAHGYLSGRDGIDEDARPLSIEGIERTVKQIGDVCRPDKSQRFLDVVPGIR